MNYNYLSIRHQCKELHIGNTPRSIMTKGNSVTIGNQYGNFIRGNKYKLMISYRREPSHDYTMDQACGVLFEGEIHFFGGVDVVVYNTDDLFPRYVDLTRQHFVIETKRSGQLVKLTKKEDLRIGLTDHSCATIDMASGNKAVMLCFDHTDRCCTRDKSCYLFDGELTYIGASNYSHYQGGLTKYKSALLTVGGAWDNQKTEILKMNRNENLFWSVVEPNFRFSRDGTIGSHSLVTIEASDMNEEYVLLIGGRNSHAALENVFKFNGTWFHFGKLNKPRRNHNSIYWKGAIYVIGGTWWKSASYNSTKMEIWKIENSPDKFKATENWPELFD